MIFLVFAFYIYTGKLYEPDANGKIKVNVITIFIGWIIEYIGKLWTALLFGGIGIAIGVKIGLNKK